MADNKEKKIPCGGFNLGEGLELSEDGKTLNVAGGGSSVQADWNQNDETAPDYVKNRPGGYTKAVPGYEITWDGVVGDKVTVGAGDGVQLVKVSDRVFTAEELVGATIIAGDYLGKVSADEIIEQNGIIATSDYQDVIVVTTGITSPEAGTYFRKTEDEFTSSLRKPGTTTTVKIPAELTTVVGGYDVAERTAVIFDGTIKASDFTEEGGK